MSETENKCDLCQGNGRIFDMTECVYCNGTGEWTFAAQSYVKTHICQCIVWDRKHCPVCKEKCHHSTTASPKQTIDDGGDGQASGPRNWDDQEREFEHDMENSPYA